MTRRLAAVCPAKINLSLLVLSRRDDGYHELDTVFQAIDLWDRLEIRPAPGLTLTCDQPGIPQDASNLVLRAATVLAAEFGVTPRGALRLEKAIPSEAGLGGGSSDAAAALLLCSRFWDLDPPPSTLAALGARIGADVPFFLVGGTARGTGRGDRIAVLEPLPETPLLLGIPPYGISTARVFAELGSRLTLPVNGVSFPRRFTHKWQTDKDFSLARNDLETVVFAGWPELKDFRDALLGSGAARALLSGSGSTVFGTFADRALRDRAAERLARRFGDWRGIRTQTIGGGVRIEPDL